MVLKVSLNTGINRIRLEFKVEGLMWFTFSASGINRIRLEFKADRLDDLFGKRKVLIESDWNLKETAM